MGLTSEERLYRAYLNADDSQQFDIIRERWSRLNWALLNKAEDAVSSIEKGESTAKVSPIVLAAGIGYDKLYAKRTNESKPLSFPEPLLAMVRKGLLLANTSPSGSKAPEAGVAKSKPLETSQTQGGVAWPDPAQAEGGHSPPSSRQADGVSNISETPKAIPVAGPRPPRPHELRKRELGLTAKGRKPYQAVYGSGPKRYVPPMDRGGIV